MYLRDLSPYPHKKEHQFLSTLSVGWLAKQHPYFQGETSEDFKERLFVFCLNHVRQTRGFHVCEFCTPSPPFLVYAQRDDKEVWLGSAEIRVVYQGNIYAAPDLIYHYVIEHQYRPPDEFIEAVLEGPLPGSPKYETLIKKL